MKRALKSAATIALGCAVMALPAGVAFAKEYIIAVNKPNNLHLIDADAREVVRTCELPGRGSPIATAVAPDGNHAYVLTNGWGEIVGVNLDNCDVTFHAVLSQGNVRARSMAGISTTLDGSEILVQVSEVELLADRYNIRPNHRLLAFKTDAGLDAQPHRSFDVPRGNTILAPSHDGETFWTFGHEIRQIDVNTGEIKQEILLNSWEDARPTYGDPDGLSFWPLYDNLDVMIFPYFAPVFADRAARDAGDWDQLADFVVGITKVDLRTNEWTQNDITSADVLIFSMTQLPSNPSTMFGVYTQLSKYDLDKGELIDRVDLDHTYYSVAIAKDEDELYIGSTFNDIAFHSTETLEKLGGVSLPGGDMAAAGIRVVHR